MTPTRKPWEGRTQFQVYVALAEECAAIVRNSSTKAEAEIKILALIPEPVRAFQGDGQ
jgi:hypothetical protein